MSLCVFDVCVLKSITLSIIYSISVVVVAVVL